MTPAEPDSGRDDATVFMLRSYAHNGHRSFIAPSPDVIVRRARRRTTTKMVLSFAAVVAVAAGGVVAITGISTHPDRNQPATDPSPAPSSAIAPSAPPTTSPSASSDPSRSRSASPNGTGSAAAPVSVHGVDWENTTITISASTGDECLTGRIRIVNGVGGVSGDAPHLRISPGYDSSAATYGDLDGDGRDEAAVWGSCLAGAGDEDASGQILVVTGRSGRLAGSWVGPVAEVINDVEITGGRLTITSTKKYADPEVPVERTYRWTGTRYVRA